MQLRNKPKNSTLEITGANTESGIAGMEHEHLRTMVFHQVQDDKTRGPSNGVKTPDAKTREGCPVQYEVPTTPPLQNVKKKLCPGQWAKLGGCHPHVSGDCRSDSWSRAPVPVVGSIPDRGV